MIEPLRVGVAGLGTVGASVVRILARQENALAARSGRPVRVTAVAARDRGSRPRHRHRPLPLVRRPASLSPAPARSIASSS